MSKRIKTCIALLMFFVLCFCSCVSATNVSSLQDKKSEIQSQIDAAEDKKEEIHVELTEALSKISELEKQIDENTVEFNKVKAELNDLEAQIAEKEKKLEELQADYDKQNESFENRIVALYENGETTYLDVLLNSSSIVDFVSNYYLIGEIAEYDTELLNTIKQEKDEIQQIKEALDAEKTIVKSKKDSQEATLIALNNAKLQRDNYAQNLTDQEKKVQSQLDEYKKELENIENEIRAIASGSTANVTYTGGNFAWPTPGYRTITSYYGTRLHPIYKVYKTHTGIDIGAPSGAKIIASKAGKVIASRWISGYGNTIMIDHGGGYVTLYGHGSKLVATEGQNVAQGDVVMLVGSTGNSTGPHCHFEIRINGSTVDPLQYL